MFIEKFNTQKKKQKYIFLTKNQFKHILYLLMNLTFFDNLGCFERILLAFLIGACLLETVSLF